MIERFEPVTNIFDFIQHYWFHRRVQRAIALIVFLGYVVSLIVIEANREGLLPAPFGTLLPTNHFQAIQGALTLILLMGTVSLIMSISLSLSKALGHQFEIMALILLRGAFRELSALPEPVALADAMPLLRIGTAGTGALIIFVCLGFYNRLRTHQNFIDLPEERMRYVMAKKSIALTLLIIVVGIAIRDVIILFSTGKDVAFFETVYTMLIFADIAFVLISQRYMPTFPAVFRNSAFVISTLLMRLSLSASFPWNTVACIFAAVYILGLTAAMRYFGSSIRTPH